MIASRSFSECLCPPQCFLTLPDTKQLPVEKRTFSLREEGTNPLSRWGWIKVSHRAPLSPPKKWEYLFSMFIINMFSSVRRPNGESHWVEKWKKEFFSLSVPIFFCYNDSPGAMGILGPNRGEQRHRKQRALQLHACGPLRLPRGQTKTNINVGSLLQE